MHNWTGLNVFQWEHKRTWQLANNGTEICRAEGALVLPGFTSLSIFLRRESQTAEGEFELGIWTAPLFTQPLDDDFSQNPSAYLYPLALAPTGGLKTGASGTGARVFGAQIAAGQPMGSLLFWQMKNNAIGSLQSITADIYVVPNHTGSMMLDRIGRTIDVGTSAGGGARSLTGMSVDRSR